LPTRIFLPLLMPAMKNEGIPGFPRLKALFVTMQCHPVTLWLSSWAKSRTLTAQGMQICRSQLPTQKPTESRSSATSESGQAALVGFAPKVAVQVTTHCGSRLFEPNVEHVVSDIKACTLRCACFLRVFFLVSRSGKDRFLYCFSYDCRSRKKDFIALPRHRMPSNNLIFPVISAASCARIRDAAISKLPCTIFIVAMSNGSPAFADTPIAFRKSSSVGSRPKACRKPLRVSASSIICRGSSDTRPAPPIT